MDMNQKFEYLDKHDLPSGRYLKELYTSDEFRFVYGQIKLIFSINEGNIIFENLEPQQFLLDGYYNLLGVYKGLPYRNIKDKFKIDLLLKMKIDRVEKIKEVGDLI